MDAVVPPGGPVQLGSVRLPPGAQITNWREEPLLWATSAPVAGAGLTWLELRDLHEQTGPVPILLAYLHGGAEGRPWDSGEQAGRAADVLAPPSRSGAP